MTLDNTFFSSQSPSKSPSHSTHRTVNAKEAQSAVLVADEKQKQLASLVMSPPRKIKKQKRKVLSEDDFVALVKHLIQARGMKLILCVCVCVCHDLV